MHNLIGLGEFFNGLFVGLGVFFIGCAAIWFVAVYVYKENKGRN